jgi:hypothetical protein
MAIDNAQRSRLFSTLEPVLGLESAEVIMNSLNFQGTESLATKDDLRLAVSTLQSEFEGLRHEIDDKFERMIAQIEKKFLNMKIWFLVTGAGIALAVVNLYKK